MNVIPINLANYITLYIDVLAGLFGSWRSCCIQSIIAQPVFLNRSQVAFSVICQSQKGVLNVLTCHAVDTYFKRRGITGKNKNLWKSSNGKALKKCTVQRNEHRGQNSTPGFLTSSDTIPVYPPWFSILNRCTCIYNYMKLNLRFNLVVWWNIHQCNTIQARKTNKSKRVVLRQFLPLCIKCTSSFCVLLSKEESPTSTPFKSLFIQPL